MTDFERNPGVEPALKRAIELMNASGAPKDREHADRIQEILDQEGCEVHDPKAPRLVDLINIIIYG